MAGKRRGDLRAEAIRLRVEERLSDTEVATALDGAIDRSTVCRWLTQHPLSVVERRKKQAAAAQSRAKKIAQCRPEPSALWRSSNVQALTRRQKGQVAEAAVRLRCALQGFSVFVSAHDCDRIDALILVPGGKTHKLQIRWCRRLEVGLPGLSLKSINRDRHRRYERDDFDFIVGYDLFQDAAFVFSWDETKEYKSAITLRPSAREAWHKLL